MKSRATSDPGMQMKDLKRIEVLWRDTSAKPGWCDNVDMEKKTREPDYICTIGYLLKKTRDKVVMTFGHSCWNTYMEILTIPRCSIVGITELVEKDA